MAFSVNENISLLRMREIRKTPAELDCPAVSSEEFVVEHDDKECTAPIWVDRQFGVFLKLKTYNGCRLRRRKGN
ncbi:hypothetical protein TNCV_3025831 [Trichonephila clavipes]|nr:hypothetical protein TNCV_3025831 [Trichonephila clavipes]